MIEEAALNTEVGRLLGKLYGRRFAALEGLKLTKLLNKNPYLYRAVGLNDPAKLIEQMLVAFISSSDETIFGNEFFEPLALWSAKESTATLSDARTVTVGGGAGRGGAGYRDRDGNRLSGNLREIRQKHLQLAKRQRSKQRV